VNRWGQTAVILIMRTVKFSSFLLLLLLFCSHGYGASHELLLFFDNAEDPVTKDFLETYAPQIKEMAEAQEVSVKMIDVTDGAPELVRFTPAIVFQNHLGRSLYIGRYHYVDKIKTFLRTVKRLPQKDVVNKKHDVMVWDHGKTHILTPLKVTPLKGDLPKGFDEETFHTAALAAIAKGTQNYRLMEHYEARRTDRLMYAALYPYVNKSGQLSISLEIYSQFNCVDPVFKMFDEPVFGKLEDMEQVFQQAGALLESQIVRQLKSIERGDGLIPVAQSVPSTSFEALNLPLPQPPRNGNADRFASKMTMPLQWTFDGPIADDVPLINFNFPAPLDYYAGEITKMKGSMNLGEDANVEQALASFTAFLKNMTMGDESLDEHVAEMIELMDFPSSDFTFKKVTVVDQAKLNFGAMTQIVVEGTLDFKGIKAPVKVSSQLEPLLNEKGEPRIQVYAFFKMPLKREWDVTGPDGPEEASDFLDFNLNFLLKPGK